MNSRNYQVRNTSSEKTVKEDEKSQIEEIKHNNIYDIINNTHNRQQEGDEQGNVTGGDQSQQIKDNSYLLNIDSSSDSE